MVVYIAYIMNYYKNLFGDSDEGNFTMDESRTEDIPQVSAEENDLLTTSGGAGIEDE
jgi:hypothetical protein